MWAANITPPTNTRYFLQEPGAATTVYMHDPKCILMTFRCQTRT